MRLPPASKQRLQLAMPTAVVAAALASLNVPASAAGPTALVARVLGAPTITHSGSAIPAKVGSTLEAGDVVTTDDKSKVKILLPDDSVLDIGSRSKVTLDALALEPSSRRARIAVELGRFKLAVSKFFGGSTDYEVKTPTAVAGVRGTVLWGDTELDTICSLDGNVEVRTTSGTSRTTQLPAGICLGQLGKGGAIPSKPSDEDVAKYLKAVTIE